MGGAEVQSFQFSIDRTSLNQNFSLAENLINFT